MPDPAEYRSVDALGDDRLDELCVALVNQGYCIMDQVLPEDLMQALQREATELPADALRPAGTGRDAAHQFNASVRSDRIRWLQRDSLAAVRYLDFAEGLREGINSRLFLGLFDYECHYSRYEPGAFYGKHKDAFAGRRNRLVSTVLYLNDDWKPEDGGELLLYPDKGPGEPLRILPLRNRLLCFLSELFPHEVLPARRQRCSVAGWFRVRED